MLHHMFQHLLRTLYLENITIHYFNTKNTSKE
ncbi:unnamed protein product [Spirodela intermedia]|uniref:Uncharacterized protein n=1 Tax=Spirodela intermedia TaxID=51605 RepID=A0A7I8J5K5_SPIIN|nr:unnamed protein product [Spirodela intermedia]CAA6664683.1 unnamed protein product [Spirodela intermedia]